MEDSRILLQEFQRKLNQEPKADELGSTPDGKAQTLPISFVEMTLDEIFFGQWSTENFKWSAIANEVQGSLELVLIHPVNQREIRRTGAASIVIQVDKAPEDVKGQARNEWALNPSNKKSNALDLGFPKLKAECLKNAAQSLGKIFGRDLNRKQKDTFQAQLIPIPDKVMKWALDQIETGKKEEWEVLALCSANFILTSEQIAIIKSASPKLITQ